MGNNISTCMPKRYKSSHGLHYHTDQAVGSCIRPKGESKGPILGEIPRQSKKGQRYKSMQMVQIAVTEINSNQKLLVIWLVVTF